MAAYCANNDCTYLEKMPYDYEYSRATMTSQRPDILGQPKPLTASNQDTSNPPGKRILSAM
jgi:hypothetical protein